MKWNNYIWAAIVGCCVLCGCKDDIASAGAGALANDEEVRVRVKTLTDINSITMDRLEGYAITQTPDSFLIGECNTEKWATIKADLLTQFACPEGFEYPADIDASHTTQVDSVALMMTYNSWFADGLSPLKMSVYEMDLNTFDYSGKYTSDINISEYWSGQESTRAIEEDMIVTAARPADSIYNTVSYTYVPLIRFMMNKAFVKKMNALKKFPSQTEFNNNVLKGLYITTTAGASTALYVANIRLAIYYHYYYETAAGSGIYEKVDHIKYLYANNEVRQVNRYAFPYKEKVITELKKEEDSVNYVVSPGYVYTTIKVPTKMYVDTIVSNLITKTGDTLQPYINKAIMRVDVLNVNTTDNSSDRWANPASDMLLIHKDSLATFFTSNKLPSADYCLLASLSTSVDDDSKYLYYYDFDVSTLLYNEVHKRMMKGEGEDLEMVMVPVFVEYSSTSTAVVVSQVKINQTITYTRLRSAQNKDNPLDIDVVFSGFTINTIH